MESKNKKINIIQIIGILLIIAGGISTYYFYNKYNDLKNNPNIVASEELSSITQKVGELMELPVDETPSLATVENKDELIEQEFFSTAEDGDKLLLYTNAKIAILYRPSTNKIVKVAPLVLEETQEVEEVEEVETPTTDEKTTTKR